VLRLVLLIGAIGFAVVVLFAIATALGVPLLTDPGRYLELGAPGSTALACGLLVADVLLPVPSSLLLAYLGAAHGIVIGAALGTAAHALGGAIGFGIGRASRGPIDRWIGEAERARIDGLLARWGMLGIAASRPLPVLAETVAIVGGTSRGISWPRFLAAATAGSAAYAAVNAAAGAEAREGSFGLAIASALGIAIVLWLCGRFILPARRK
jgi:uncharacterized membrane protein YdjX (TVP38/TMEM64 family)